jgi:hypothetical protein
MAISCSIVDSRVFVRALGRDSHLEIYNSRSVTMRREKEVCVLVWQMLQPEGQPTPL